MNSYLISQSQSSRHGESDPVCVTVPRKQGPADPARRPPPCTVCEVVVAAFPCRFPSFASGRICRALRPWHHRRRGKERQPVRTLMPRTCLPRPLQMKSGIRVQHCHVLRRMNLAFHQRSFCAFPFPSQAECLPVSPSRVGHGLCVQALVSRPQKLPSNIFVET